MAATAATKRFAMSLSASSPQKWTSTSSPAETPLALTILKMVSLFILSPSLRL